MLPEFNDLPIFNAAHDINAIGQSLIAFILEAI